MSGKTSSHKKSGSPESARPKSAGSKPSSGSTTIAFLLLGVLVVSAFLPVGKNGFVSYDDPQYVTANGMVQQGLSGATIRWAFETSIAGNWHPLTLWSHALDCQLFGLNAEGHHIVSLLLHLANTMLLFIVLKNMTGAVGRSFFVAALFGVHPLHVESVAWISERKDVLSTFFGLLSIWAYVRFAEARGRRSEVRGRKSEAANPSPAPGLRPLTSGFYWLALLFFGLGLMSKPMLVTLPCLLLLLDFWPLKRASNFSSPNITRLLEKAPFFAGSIVVSLITLAAQRREGTIATIVHLPFPDRIENALVSYWRYIGKLFYPADLAVFYPYPDHWPAAAVFVAGLGLVAISLFVWWQRAKFPFLLVGWFWFVGTLVPVIGLVQVGMQSMADRYSYLPSVGLFIMIAWGAAAMIVIRRHRLAISLVAAAAIVACIPVTRAQVAVWADSEALFQHALSVTTNNWMAHAGLGLALRRKGLTGEALDQYRQAVALNPDYADVRNNFGAALLNEQRYEEAVAQLQQATRLNPSDASAHNNLGAAWYREGRLDDAIGELKESLRLRPDDSRTRSNLTSLLEEKAESTNGPGSPPPP